MPLLLRLWGQIIQSINPQEGQGDDSSSEIDCQGSACPVTTGPLTSLDNMHWLGELIAGYWLEKNISKENIQPNTNAVRERAKRTAPQVHLTPPCSIGGLLRCITLLILNPKSIDITWESMAPSPSSLSRLS